MRTRGKFITVHEVFMKHIRKIRCSNMAQMQIMLLIICLVYPGCHFFHKDDASPKAELSAAEWFKKGTSHAAKRHYDEALEAYNKALKKDSLYASVYFYRAQVWEEKGKLKKAIKDYNKVLKINPGLEKAYNYRGNVWESRGKLDKAIRDYTKAIELNPELASAWHDRGNAWGKKGNYDQAISDFDKALEIAPREAIIYDKRGNAWARKGDYGKAISDFDTALRISPDLVTACNNLAWLLSTCPNASYRDGIRAVRLAQRALELSPDVSSMDTLAAAYAEAGRFDDAVETMERLLLLLYQRDPESLKSYRKHLASYKSEKPWREEWSGRNAE